jgi:hypothetical protein
MMRRLTQAGAALSLFTMAGLINLGGPSDLLAAKGTTKGKPSDEMGNRASD